MSDVGHLSGVGFGQDDAAAPEDCPPGRSWDPPSGTCVCGPDSIDVAGVCKDQSTMCGPGTQWVAADNACVPLTKYMSTAQIAAAIKAGVDLTGKGPGVSPIAVPAQRVATATAAPKPSIASIFGPNTPYIVGGVIVGALVLGAFASKKKTSH